MRPAGRPVGRSVGRYIFCYMFCYIVLSCWKMFCFYILTCCFDQLLPKQIIEAPQGPLFEAYHRILSVYIVITNSVLIHIYIYMCVSIFVSDKAMQLRLPIK